ncbi:MAG: hypothetical protein ACLR8P_15145 [Clostridium fessum]
MIPRQRLPERERSICRAVSMRSTVTVKAANGNLRNYVLHVVRQSGGPTYSSSIGSGVSSGSSSSGPATGPGMSSGSSSGNSSSGGSGCADCRSDLFREAVQEALLPGSLHRDRM